MRTSLSLSCVLLTALGSRAQCEATIPPTSVVFSASSGNLTNNLTPIWICEGGYPSIAGNLNLIYMEDGATLALVGDSNVIYSKGENYIYLNPGSDFNVVIHEGTGVNIADNGTNNTALPCAPINFDYSMAPTPGCAGVGVVEPTATSVVTVYPTGLTDRLHIKTEGNITVRSVWLLDAKGRVILAPSVVPAGPIDVHALVAGIYIVKLATDQGTFTRFVVKL